MKVFNQFIIICICVIRPQPVSIYVDTILTICIFYIYMAIIKRIILNLCKFNAYYAIFCYIC